MTDESAAGKPWDVLAACLTGRPTGDVTAEAWQAVVALAGELHLGPLLYCALGEASVLPPEARARLRDLHASAGRAAVVHYRVLHQVAQAFARADVRFILLKGFALAETIYPDRAARPMVDLDLLVKAPDVERAIALLETLGYRLRPDHSPDFDRRFGGELTFEHAGGSGPPIELHWELLHFEWFRGVSALPVEELWGRARPLTVGLTAAWQLSAEDTLIYLCAHLAVHHAYRELRQFADLDRLIRYGPALDWDALTDAARRYRLRRVVYFALFFTQRLFGARLPDGVLNRLQPPALIRWCVELLAAPGRALHGGPRLGLQAERLLHFLLADRGRDRWRGLVQVFFPGRAWIAARYGYTQPLHVLWGCLWHPVRMAGLALQALGQIGAIPGQARNGS